MKKLLIILLVCMCANAQAQNNLLELMLKMDTKNMVSYGYHGKGCAEMVVNVSTENRDALGALDADKTKKLIDFRTGYEGDKCTFKIKDDRYFYTLISENMAILSSFYVSGDAGKEKIQVQGILYAYEGKIIEIQSNALGAEFADKTGKSQMNFMGGAFVNNILTDKMPADQKTAALEIYNKIIPDVKKQLTTVYNDFLVIFATTDKKNQSEKASIIYQTKMSNLPLHTKAISRLTNKVENQITDNKKSNEQDFADKIKNKTYGNMQDIVDFVRKNKDLEFINVWDDQIMPYRPKEKPIIKINKGEIIIEVVGTPDSWDLKAKITSTMEKPTNQKAKTPFILDDDGIFGADLHISDRAKTMFYYDGMLVVRHSNERKKRTQTDKDEGDFSKRPYISHRAYASNLAQ